MTAPMSIHGQQLYDLLPDVYRERDLEIDPAAPHLRAYLDAHGALLDRVRATLEQFYKDHFPDALPGGEGNCQDWIIPYLGSLVGVEHVSPFPDGQRAEVANAIRWNQRKGTRLITDEIAEAIIQNEVVVQEGWRRVFMTAALDTPLLPAISFGEVDPSSVDTNSADDDGIDGFYQQNARRPGVPLPALNPQLVARHPGIQAFTVNINQNSRAYDVQGEVLEYELSNGSKIELDLEVSLTSQASLFGGGTNLWPTEDQPFHVDETKRLPWIQRFRNGVPCFRDSYEDVSPRSVDVHDPQANDGRGHYHPKRALVFLPPPRGMCADVGSADLDINALIGGTATSVDDAISIAEDPTSGEIMIKGDPLALNPEVLTGHLEIDDGKTWRFEHVRFNGTLEVKDGTVHLHRCAVRTLIIEGQVNSATSPSIPVVVARDCLFDAGSGEKAGFYAEYCTILNGFSFSGFVWASEVIFPEFIDVGTTFECVRYSRVATWMLQASDDETPPSASSTTNTSLQPVFVETEFCSPGAGVLALACGDAISKGAEDGGEMGAYHAWRFAAQRTALIRKLKDYLPLGIEPVIIWDPRLLCAPPKKKTV